MKMTFKKRERRIETPRSLPEMEYFPSDPKLGTIVVAIAVVLLATLRRCDMAVSSTNEEEVEVYITLDEVELNDVEEY